MERRSRGPLPADGSLDRVIEVPCRNPTSLAFGGSALDTLFITTSRLTLTRGTRRQPLAGTLLAAPRGEGAAETLRVMSLRGRFLAQTHGQPCASGFAAEEAAENENGVPYSLDIGETADLDTVPLE